MRIRISNLTKVNIRKYGTTLRRINFLWIDNDNNLCRYINSTGCPIRGVFFKGGK